jgi:serine/threonine protein phosphatase PrpC
MSTMFQTTKITQGYRSRCQDRVDIIDHATGIVLALADGAGGISGGEEAADTMLLWARAHVTQIASLHGGEQWAALLSKVDKQIPFANGETTGVIVAIWDGGLAGASVGDSAAWIIRADGYDDLTAAQVRKPLLGSGQARPVPFERPGILAGETVLLCSDGLAKYAIPNLICAAANQADLSTAARDLVELVRLKSGTFHDDVGIVLARPSPPQSSLTRRSSRPTYTLTADGNLVDSE